MTSQNTDRRSTTLLAMEQDKEIPDNTKKERGKLRVQKRKQLFALGPEMGGDTSDSKRARERVDENLPQLLDHLGPTSTSGLMGIRGSQSACCTTK